MIGDPLSTFVERSGGRPIYVTSPIIMAPLFTDIVADLLRNEHPSATFVNSRGRYRSSADWRQRWPAERDSYGAAVILTAGEPTDDDPGLDGEGVAGAHIVGMGIWQEARDLLERDRPLLWIPYWRSQQRRVTRFTVDPLRLFSQNRFALLSSAIDAKPFRPAIGASLFTATADNGAR